MCLGWERDCVTFGSGGLKSALCSTCPGMGKRRQCSGAKRPGGKHILCLVTGWERRKAQEAVVWPGRSPSYSHPGLTDWSPRVGVGAGCETGHLNSSLHLFRIHRQGTRSVWTWVFPPMNWGALQHSFQYHRGADKPSETADPPENDQCHLAPPLGRLPALLPATPSPLSCPDRGEGPMCQAPPRAPRGLAAALPESTFLLH